MARGRRVPRPPAPGEWDIRYWRNSVEDDWDKLVAVAPPAAARAWEWLRRRPRERTDRNHPLRGSLAAARHGGRTYERWQHEVTGSGRIWFLIDDRRRTIFIEKVTTGHPKETE
jgi:hypothetical protein